MKTYHERTAEVSARIRQKKRQRRIISATCLSLALILVAGMVFFSGEQTVTPNTPVNAHLAGSYTEVAKMLQASFDNEDNLGWEVSEDAANSDALAPTLGAAPGYYGNSGTGKYEEVTDNQVQGVTEADLFKRSDKYIFYLSGSTVTAYSIAGADSEKVGCYEISFTEEMYYLSVSEMYLSQDCTTLTVILQPYLKNVGAMTMAVSLDVSDPANIVENGRQCVSGYYVSSRMVNGTLLIMSKFHVYESEMDIDDVSTYIPSIGTDGEMEPVDPESILLPGETDATYYTVICTMDEKTMQTVDSLACLGFTDDIYVSQSCIYINREYSQRDENSYSSSFSEIARISYDGAELTAIGSVVLEGTVKDQYSMDEYNGVLRVVTSISSWRESGRVISASLYCVSLETMEVVASVNDFAPQGETAQSVRFDGDTAYVCTAEVITMTDPVFFFDLSDLENITWTDTGVISGYSSSLVQLGDGFLLGIGYSSSRALKIEVYAEDGDSVISVDAYLRECNFSETYKSYYINREENLVGLAIYDWNGQTRYLLLHFDGMRLNVIRQIVLHESYSYVGDVRATMIDGYLYILSENGLTVEFIW